MWQTYCLPNKLWDVFNYIKMNKKKIVDIAIKQIRQTTQGTPCNNMWQTEYAKVWAYLLRYCTELTGVE